MHILSSHPAGEDRRHAAYAASAIASPCRMNLNIIESACVFQRR